MKEEGAKKEESSDTSSSCSEDVDKEMEDFKNNLNTVLRETLLKAAKKNVLKRKMDTGINPVYTEFGLGVNSFIQLLILLLQDYPLIPQVNLLKLLRFLHLVPNMTYHELPLVCLQL